MNSSYCMEGAGTLGFRVSGLGLLTRLPIAALRSCARTHFDDQLNERCGRSDDDDDDDDDDDSYYRMLVVLVRLL